MDETRELERIRALFEEVQGLRPVFEGTVEFCRVPRYPADIDNRFEELTQYNYCVFSPVRVRALLEEAGALKYLEPEQPEGTGQIERSGQVGERAERIDGQKDDDGFLDVTVRPVGTWVATEAGLRVVNERNDEARLAELLEEDTEFREEYEKVLFALNKSSKSIKELNDLVDLDERMVAAHRFAPYLVKKLEDCGAIEFKGSWTIRETGRAYLSKHAQVSHALHEEARA